MNVVALFFGFIFLILAFLILIALYTMKRMIEVVTEYYQKHDY